MENTPQANGGQVTYISVRINGLAPSCSPTPPSPPRPLGGAVGPELKGEFCVFWQERGERWGTGRWDGRGWCAKWKEKLFHLAQHQSFFVVKDRCSTPSFPTHLQSDRDRYAQEKMGAKWRMGWWIKKKGHSFVSAISIFPVPFLTPIHRREFNKDAPYQAWQITESASVSAAQYTLNRLALARWWSTHIQDIQGQCESVGFQHLYDQMSEDNQIAAQNAHK